MSGENSVEQKLPHAQTPQDVLPSLDVARARPQPADLLRPGHEVAGEPEHRQTPAHPFKHT